jgi:hypothetical protein
MMRKIKMSLPMARTFQNDEGEPPMHSLNKNSIAEALKKIK